MASTVANSFTASYDNQEQEKEQEEAPISTNNSISLEPVKKWASSQQPIEIETKLIEVKSSPRMRKRGKIHISGPQADNENGKKKSKEKKLLFEESEEQQSDKDNLQTREELDNVETRHTKSVNEHEAEDYRNRIYEEDIHEIKLESHTKNINRDLREMGEHDIMLPCQARRELRHSDEEEDIQERDEEYENDSEEEEHYHNKRVSPKVFKQPSVEIPLTHDNLETFLHMPINMSYKCECMIEIQKGFCGIGNRYNLKQKGQSKILISAKKELMSLSPKIILSMNRDNHSRRHPDFLGVVEGNFGGTEWKLQCPIIPNRYNQGLVCEDVKEMLAFNYKTSVLGSKSLRQMEAYIIDPSIAKQKRKYMSVQKQLESEKAKHLVKLESAKPKLVKGRYALDFHGVAKMPSNKNMILVVDGRQCLIFAKQNESSYAMNIKYPLSLIQGFSICLASLNSKLLVN